MSKIEELLEEILEIKWAGEPSYDEWRGYHFTISADDRDKIIGNTTRAVALLKQPKAGEAKPDLQIGWYNPASKRFCYVDEKETRPERYRSYSVPVYAIPDIIEEQENDED